MEYKHQLIQKKEELDSKLTQLVQEFEKDTGFFVSGVEITRMGVQTIGNNDSWQTFAKTVITLS
jgi:hypothetical protein